MSPLPLKILLAAPSGEARYLVVIAPGDPTAGEAILPQAIVGSFAPTGTEVEMTPGTFARNPVFVDFLHAVIARFGPLTADLRRAAQLQQSGWLYVIDGRTPTPAGDVPLEDVIGAFEIQDGRMMPDTYTRIDEHRIFSERGFFMLSDELARHLVESLAALGPGQRRTWSVEGFDTFAGERYPVGSDFATEREAVAAASVYLAELERTQPAASSGGQDGVQDRVVVVRPDGTHFTVTA
jgi:hypothetical protein